MSKGPTAQLRHDLRTPLTHLIGYSEMLLEDAPLPELRTIRAESRDMLPLINAFLGDEERKIPDLTGLRSLLDSRLTTLRTAAEEARSHLPPDLLPDLDRIVGAVAHLDDLLSGSGHTQKRSLP